MITEDEIFMLKIFGFIFVVYGVGIYFLNKYLEKNNVPLNDEE